MATTSDERKPTALVVMGVSGSGKTTIAELLSARLSWPMAEADDFHSEENKAKMAAGIPLTDEDRWPWLESLRVWIDAEHRDVILTCSALKRVYRDDLRQADARVRFCHLEGSRDEIGPRMARRTGHYMPTSLLQSQLETLEALQPDEDGVVIDIDGTPDQIADRAIGALGLVGSPDQERELTS